MRHWQGCITVTIALTLALTVSAAPVAWADPPPLAQAETAIGAENCGLPLAAWADPPPLAQAEAAIGAENCGLPLSTPYAGHRSEVVDTNAATVRPPRPSRACGPPHPSGCGGDDRASAPQHHDLDAPHRSDRHLPS
jgi:hypothetical protein